MKHVHTVTKPIPAKAEGLPEQFSDLLTCVKDIVQNPLDLVQQVTQKGN